MTLTGLPWHVIMSYAGTVLSRMAHNDLSCHHLSWWPHTVLLYILCFKNKLQPFYCTIHRHSAVYAVVQCLSVCLSVTPVSLNFFSRYLKPLTLQPLSENLLMFFCTGTFEFLLQIFDQNLTFDN